MTFKGSAGAYQVFADDGRPLGRVQRFEKSYRGIRGSSGRRLGSYTYWRAIDLNGQIVSHGEHTRRGAAALLARGAS